MYSVERVLKDWPGEFAGPMSKVSLTRFERDVLVALSLGMHDFVYKEYWHTEELARKSASY
jgi:hypothetical protein